MINVYDIIGGSPLESLTNKEIIDYLLFERNICVVEIWTKQIIEDQLNRPISFEEWYHFLRFIEYDEDCLFVDTRSDLNRRWFGLQENESDDDEMGVEDKSEAA